MRVTAVSWSSHHYGDEEDEDDGDDEDERWVSAPALLPVVATDESRTGPDCRGKTVT